MCSVRKECSAWASFFVACSLVGWVSGVGTAVGEDGGYRGVVAALAEGLDVEDSEKFLDCLKSLMQRTSDLLYDATEGRLYFADVKILLPKSWNQSSAIDYTEKFEDAEIRVDKVNPTFGHLPYARVVRPCGQGGEYIHVTSDLVLGKAEAIERVGDAARALVHVWARYRWGVFEEYGYPGDPVNPYFYEASQGHWLPTGCSSNYHGHLRTTEGAECLVALEDGRPEDRCRFFPDEEDATASLMYLHNLKSPPKFCSAKSHDRLAPNRQNTLCGHRSSWEVMEKHEDFKLKRSETKKQQTKFTLVQSSGASKSNIMIVLDTSRSGLSYDIWKHLRAGLRDLLASLPDDASVGIATYEGDGARYVFVELAPLSGGSLGERRKELTGAISYVREGRERGRNSSRALLDASEAVGRSGLLGRVQMVFSRLGRGSGTENAAAIGSLRRRMIRVVGLSFSDSANMLSLCLRTGGRWFKSRKGSVDSDVREALEFASLGRNANSQVYQVATGALHLGQRESNEASIYVEEALGRRASFLIESADGAVTSLVSPNGTAVDVSKGDCRLVNGQFQCQFDDAEPGNWTLRVECRSNPCGPQTTLSYETYSQERKRSEGREFPGVRFLALGREGIVDLSRGDFLAYAEVSEGHRPILGVEVVLKVENMDGPHEDVDHVSLKDDGLDPDLVADDGVYSGIVIPSASGTFSLSLSVRGGAGKPELSHVAQKEGWSIMPRDQETHCRGSNAYESGVSEGYVMQRTMDSFLVVKVTGVNGYMVKPQRIRDLKVILPVKYESESALVTLQWTSPRPRDASKKDRVQKYLLYYSFDADTILSSEPPFNVSVVQDVLPIGGLAPLPAGETQTVISAIPLEAKGNTVYFRIRSINEKGTKSEYSQVVQVHLKGQEEWTTTGSPSTAPEPTSKLINPTESLSPEGRAFPSKREALRYKSTANAVAVNDTDNKGDEDGSVVGEPWFIGSVTTVCLAVAVGSAVAFACILRRRSAGKGPLGWICFKGSLLIKRSDSSSSSDKAKGTDVYANGVWSCMSTGYPSTANLANGTTNAYANEGFVQGPYKEVFIRHPDDVTTEL